MSFQQEVPVRTTIIVDASSNHGGDIACAKKMIQAAADCGADYIKFQSWQAARLRPGDPNYERHKKAELSDEHHFILIEECRKRNIKFLTTCFDIHRVDFLATLGMDMIKVPSTEISSLKMIQRLAEKFDNLILSTGAAYTQEIEEAVNLLQQQKKVFALLHCMSIYPTPLEQMNLARINWLKKYTPYVGLSDHSLGYIASQMAIVLGARFIEKHFTLDRNLPGKDQQMSSTPDDIAKIVEFRNIFLKAWGKETYDLSNAEKSVRENYIGKWGDNRN